MTLQDLKYRVLLRLGVVAAGEAPNADDGATVALEYESLLSMLLEKDLVDWVSEEDIPEEFETPIVAMVCAESVGHFAHPDPASIIGMGKFGLVPLTPAERQLRQLSAKTYVSKTTRTEYF